MKAVLVLGPRYKPGREIGGAVVLFENLIQEFEENKINFYIIDTNKKAHRFRLISFASILYQSIKFFKKTDVLLLNSSGDYFYILPSLLFINYFYKKKIFLRKFGGELDRSLQNKIKGPLIRYLFPKLDGLFVESKKLAKIFSGINKNVVWFPNVRKKYHSSIVSRHQKYSGKFVFISQLKFTKGAGVLIEAFSKLDKKYTIDFYGPVIDDVLEQKIKNKANINYNGTLLPGEVFNTLSNYDVVILPTFYEGEGYPGIIIEAYSCCKPVITTNWNQIPEIVEDGKTGYLIAPQSSFAIVEAVEKFNAENYDYFSRNACNKFKEFDSEIVTKNIIKVLEQ